MTANETLDQIRDNCRSYFELEEDIFSDEFKGSRRAELVRARWFVYYIANEIFNFTKRDISVHFKVDYTAVTGGIRNLRFLVTYDKKAIEDFNNLRSITLSSKRIKTKIENIVHYEIVRQLPNTKPVIVERIASLVNIQIMKLLT